MSTPRFVLVAALAALLAAPIVTAVEKHKGTEKAVKAEPRPGKALVYMIRQDHFTASARTIYLFSDRTFMGALDNDCFSFAYVDPGRHLIWTNWTRITREIELAADQTYYIDVFQTIGLLNEEDGKALIAKAECYATPTESETAKAAEHIENRYARAAAREGKKEKAPLDADGAAAVSAVPAAPENTEGLLQVPAGTSVKLRLTETATSGFSKTGETVWFEVVEDVTVEDQLLLSEGTRVRGLVRQAQKGKGGGIEGVLEIDLPAVKAADGTNIPVAGQIVTSGKSKADKAATVAIAAGALWSLAVKGLETYHLAGEEIVARTRADAWVKLPLPAAGDSAATAPPLGALPEPVGAALAASWEGAADPDEAIVLEPHTRSEPKEIRIDIDSAGAVKSVEIYAVAGQLLPEPVRPLKLDRRKAGWTAVFEGWPLVHHMPASRNPTPVPVLFRGLLEDGSPCHGKADVRFKVVLPES